MKKLTEIKIPESIKFSDLELARDPDGMVSFNRSVIEQICDASGLNAHLFFDGPKDNVSQLIVYWYESHVRDGGERDSVADDLIAETLAEDRLGAGLSHQPGRA